MTLLGSQVSPCLAAGLEIRVLYFFMPRTTRVRNSKACSSRRYVCSSTAESFSQLFKRRRRYARSYFFVYLFTCTKDTSMLLSFVVFSKWRSAEVVQLACSNRTLGLPWPLTPRHRPAACDARPCHHLHLTPGNAAQGSDAPVRTPRQVNFCRRRLLGGAQPKRRQFCVRPRLLTPKPSLLVPVDTRFSREKRAVRRGTAVCPRNDGTRKTATA